MMSYFGVFVRVLQFRIAMLAALLIVELAGIAFAYQFVATIECDATETATACHFLRSLVARAISVLAAFTIFAWARRWGHGLPRSRSETSSDGHFWLLLHFAGIALMFSPVVVAGGPQMQGYFALALAPWIIGAIATTLGALLWLASASAWRDWLAEERYLPLAVLAVAFVLPDFANLILPLWNIDVLTRLTFDAVLQLLRIVSESTYSDPNLYVIGMDEFYVQVGRPCSGVEGFALVGGFTVLYGLLFHKETRVPHFWLVMLPLGLVLSWAFNVLRIAALVWIGSRVSPDLAVNGFHSYAGWMSFTFLALSLLYVAHTVPWLQAEAPRRAAPRLRDDWNAALILPFVVFMMGSVIGSALFQHPDLAYPLKACLMAGALAVFHKVYRRLQWSLDPVAVGAGLLVGGVWIAMLSAGTSDTALAIALADLGTVAFAFWVTMRLVGTVLLVPLIEELFFRGYILTRLDGGTPVQRALAIAVSSGLFAVLHGRWFEAGFAGLVFAIVMLRRGQLFDAIAAHVVANLVVALWAFTIGDWSAI